MTSSTLTQQDEVGSDQIYGNLEFKRVAPNLPTTYASFFHVPRDSAKEITQGHPVKGCTTPGITCRNESDELRLDGPDKDKYLEFQWYLMEEDTFNDDLIGKSFKRYTAEDIRLLVFKKPNVPRTTMTETIAGSGSEVTVNYVLERTA
ncbi:hypothetical protein ACF1BP_30175 [Streptomyces sp. NPDC014735]|uniref:hypothetical protein n=1 Tax=unclassified Streptomyces TaxID=2593676 RepID=UPI0036F4D93D